jgi:haloalkane dehalogenase
MAVIRTPDERFENLPDFDYAPHYVEVNGLRMHYVDEGTGQVILCLHGEPTWCYLYRRMIPILSQAHRVVAPDFIGFGRSDKYTEMDDYSFQMHRDFLVGFLEALDLRDITLICQDWGGLIGLRVAAEVPDRFARLVIMNTGLPTGQEKMSDAFQRWREFAQNTPDMPIGMIIQRTLLREDVGEDVIAAYEAPFPDAQYKAGAQVFPLLVPVSEDDPASSAMRAARKVFSTWDKPVQVMFSDGDPITRGGERFFRKLIPTAADQPEIEIRSAGHFLQEDKGEEIAQHVVEFIQRTPLA